jgi:serine/threonine protein kinase
MESNNLIDLLKFKKLLTANEVDNMSEEEIEKLIKGDSLCKGDKSALFKRFKFFKPLGHGGFGEVYLAYDRIQKCFVAIKAMPIDIKDF